MYGRQASRLTIEFGLVVVIERLIDTLTDRQRLAVEWTLLSIIAGWVWVGVWMYGWQV